MHAAQCNDESTVTSEFGKTKLTSARFGGFALSFENSKMIIGVWFIVGLFLDDKINMNSLYASHIRTTGLQKTFLATASGLCSFFDPTNDGKWRVAAFVGSIDWWIAFLSEYTRNWYECSLDWLIALPVLFANRLCINYISVVLSHRVYRNVRGDYGASGAASDEKVYAKWSRRKEYFEVNR